MKILSVFIACAALFTGTLGASNATAEGLKDILMTKTVATPSAAYQEGIERLEALRQATPQELSDELNLFSNKIDEDTIAIDEGAYVTVQERINYDGNIGYIGVVNLAVTYEMEDENESD
ncbi:DUF3316 domain-containing protein [Leucothrix sargassi]|nr:DUF3316 domain-containing protein [Leucothrix sargassi]